MHLATSNARDPCPLFWGFRKCERPCRRRFSKVISQMLIHRVTYGLRSSTFVSVSDFTETALGTSVVALSPSRVR